MSAAGPSRATEPQIHFDEIGLAFALFQDLRLQTTRHPVFALRGTRLIPSAFTAHLAVSRRGQRGEQRSSRDSVDAGNHRAVQTAAWRLHALNHRHVAVDTDLVMQVDAECGGCIDEEAIAALLAQAEEAELPAARLVVDLSNAAAAPRARLWRQLKIAGARVSLTIEAASASPLDFERVPDIIRIAAPWFAVWGTQAKLSRLLEPTVALLHRRGSSVQIEGIGTAEQMRIAVASGAGYFQGDLLERQALAGVPFDERPRRLDRYVGENVVPLFA